VLPGMFVALNLLTNHICFFCIEIIQLSCIERKKHNVQSIYRAPIIKAYVHRFFCSDVGYLNKFVSPSHIFAIAFLNIISGDAHILLGITFLKFDLKMVLLTSASKKTVDWYFIEVSNPKVEISIYLKFNLKELWKMLKSYTI
jgi:hypothetical protein